MTDKQLTEVSDLLRPRFKVIADYPENKDFPVNSIIECSIKWGGGYKYSVTDCQGTREYADIFFKRFPHLFQELQWWEERDEKELNKIVAYAKTHAGNSVRMVATIDSRWGKITFVGGKVRNIKQWLPATESEYESFINKNKQP